jgi:uncharacterized membrane protein
METYIFDWLNLGVRWLHFIAGIAWIGSSLYFVMLDNSLKAPKKESDRQRGVHGELWAVHGGGFYHSQKLLTGPKGEPLSVLELSVPAAIGISAGSLVIGWFIYDALCKSIRNELALALIVYALVVAAAYGYAHVFGARAAYIHVGALLGTIMVWNVFFHIIPGQKKMVEEIRAGKDPDPRPGIVGKQRSVHNTYFTLPVLFIMISNHYPMTYGNSFGWLILAVFILSGALIRQFFVLRHQGKVVWALPAVGVALLLGVAVALAPASKSGATAAAAVPYAEVQKIFVDRCVTCHAEKPTFAGFQQPPAGVMLDTPERVHAAAPRIHQQTIATQTMPLGNLTQMTPEERALLGKWLAEGASIK